MQDGLRGKGSDERTEARTVLKASAKRTVSLERSSVGGAGRVIKCFHAPASIRARGSGGGPRIGPRTSVGGSLVAKAVASLGDRRRALGESRALQAARQAGLPVPEVLGCKKRDGRWELVTSEVSGARPLADVLDEAFSRTGKHVDLDGLATGLAALAKKFVDAGFLHADPHPANVLVDDAGQLWVVDLARSRTGVGRARVEASLTRALSRLRELTPATFRRRIARAYFDGRPDATFIRRAERQAIRQRIDELEARVAVWRRDSSATEVRGARGGVNVVHVRERSGPAAPGWRVETIHGSPRELDAAWSTLVRAKLHRVPVAEPRALALTGTSRWLEIEVPGVKHDLRVPAPGELERLDVRLRTRGLALANASDARAVLRSPQGEALVGPTARLTKLAPGGTSA